MRSDAEELVEFDVELDQPLVEFLDEEAARLGCTRNDVLCRAVDAYIEGIGRLFKERDERRRRKEEASRTDYGAKKPPTAD